jgi:glucosyl-3-phosphoglycerate synthase
VSLGPVHHHRDFPAELLAERKAALHAQRNGGLTVTVCFPARDEAATVGRLVECVRKELVEAVPVVDEVIVVDDHSTDDTASVAVAAGATVVTAAEVLPEYGAGHGKGEALWKSVFASSGDLIVWCDADITNFDDRFVRGLVGPLLVHPEVQFVKGYYRRPEEGVLGGGRVTELVARPMLSLLFPELAAVVQPLAGEFAARRTAAEQVPFFEGYGVDLALLIDVARAFGAASIAQVDLDERIDRNRSLEELSPQALAVLLAGLRRAGVPLTPMPELRRPDGSVVPVRDAERPPMVSVPSYRRAPS